MTTLRAFAADIAWMLREFGSCVVRAGRDMGHDIREAFRRV